MSYVHTATFAVRHYEVGTGDRLTPPGLLDLFQEIAGQHADALGWSMEALMAEGRAWVLQRLGFQVEAPLPRVGETVRFETWPASADGLYATRDALAFDAEGHTLARITSRWIWLDIERRRPLRLTPGIDALAVRDRPSVLALASERPEAPAAATHAAPVTVRRADLDVNGHTNNVLYARWALEALPDELLATHALALMDLVLRAETLHRDALTSEAAEIAPGVWAHAIVRDGRPCATARTVWRPA